MSADEISHAKLRDNTTTARAEKIAEQNATHCAPAAAIFSSAAFLLGSIFFLPEFAGEPPEFSPEYEAGCWLYQLGSVGFMTVSAFDFEEARAVFLRSGGAATATAGGCLVKLAGGLVH